MPRDGIASECLYVLHWFGAEMQEEVGLEGK